MKTSSLTLIIGTVLLSGCLPQQQNNHMNGGMMDTDASDSSALFSGQDIDLSTLDEARLSEIQEVEDGDTIDVNPTIVKKTLNNTTFPMYGYNGQFPGPTIKVAQGSTFTVRMKNNIDQPTTIHWHGLRIDNANDGVPEMTQDAVLPGESFTYTVKVPDEGMYWYHPHVREDVQQDLGLYGNIWVTPKSDTAYAPVNQEIPVMLDDMLLSRNGLPLPYGIQEADYALMGRFGNMMLTNGQINPLVAKAKTGEVVRFFLTNTANTRTFKVAFSSSEPSVQAPKMKLVGGDNGRYAKEVLVENVTIAPSERVIIDVFFEKTGEFILRHIGPKSYDMAQVLIEDSPASTSYSKEFAVRTNADVSAETALAEEYIEKDPDETIHLSVVQKMMEEMGHGGMMMNHGSETDGIEWEDAMPMMNAVATKQNTQWKLIDEATSEENMNINYKFTVGQKVKMRIINDTTDQGSDHPMQHPIHFHGQRFLVLSINGKLESNHVWKDTILVPKDATVDILLDITNPGEWMMHCHIAEHLSNGMMGMFTVQ